jgi:hypothetical protein
MTDWTAFTAIAKELTRHHSDAALKRCLQLLDSTVLDQLSTKDRLFMGLGFKEGSFLKLFRYVQKRDPELIPNAPYEAVQAYNSLVRTLFTPKVAATLVVQPRVQKMATPPKEPVAAAAPVHEEKPIAAALPPVEHKVDIEQVIREEKALSSKKSTPYFQKLFHPEFMVFPDLPVEANRILSQQFEGTDVDAVKPFYEGIAHQMQALAETAERRVKMFHEMGEYARIFSLRTLHAKHFKDLQDEYGALAQEIEGFAMTPKAFPKESFSQNQANLNAAYARFSTIKAHTAETLDHIIEEADLSEVRTEDDKSAIKRRLFEIFWNISPYNDLSENFVDTRHALSDQLKMASQRFYEGQIKEQELLEVCQEMPYEHDVVKLRNEISHRASRLKDLRDELIRLLRELLETRRLLEIAMLETREISGHIVAVVAILHDVENPFQAFAKAETKDDINYVFRTFWIRIEEVQPKIEETQKHSLELLQKSPYSIREAFLHALDSLEELMGINTQLVERIQRELKSEEALFELVISHMHGIEKSYGFTRPFSFFMLIPEHKMRRECLEEAMALDKKLQEVVHFAKAMQYVKTFEEERVDVILEAFEKQNLIVEASKKPADLKMAWNGYVERMKRAARLVEDEIFLDIGLLDRHALMDVDQQELNRTLRLAVDRAKGYIFEDLKSASDLPLCTLTKNWLQEDVKAWAQVPVDQTKSTDWLLEHLRRYCHYLFDAKIIMGTAHKMLLPTCLAFMNDLRSLARYVEEKLQEIRSKHRAEWGVEWIPEAYAIRALLECFEPEEETKESFLPLVKDIEAILAKIPEASTLHLADMQKELETHLEEIDQLAKDPKKEHPFIYIPGYLAFFDLRGER